ncbi:DUF397 domain-containing protein [Streptomyces griseorubiginosus]|uniref:DUF397 domain-containing protein n=1 Tax=Streptomyces griseorubiginosus TaxID=67304 RepID=UPI0036E746F9
MQPNNWRKSSYSGDGSNCVEIAAISTVIKIRDSKTLEGEQLTFSATAWLRFISHGLARYSSA